MGTTMVEWAVGSSSSRIRRESESLKGPFVLAPYIIGAIVATIGLVLIFLRKTTDLVNFRYGDVELTLPAGLFLVIIGVVITLFPIGVQYYTNTKGLSPSQNLPTSTIQATPGNTDPNVPIPATQNPAPSPIKIDPVNTPVPCRSKFTGTGDEPPDHKLWLVIQQISTPKYYSKPVTSVADHKWIAENVILGRKNTPAGSGYMIYAVLVDDATDQLLKQRPPRESLENIPGRQVDQIQVSRSRDENGC
ncbi:MAG TPA: hypothetical protein VJT72_07800 [Pseudonocardiaceae bacterium]|nr:hypothetical protein [Pseudonocardiaceae bacterium]